MNVFACAIKYLKDHIQDTLKKKGFEFPKREDISWVLTVPTIWDDKAKTFMREAAQKV